MPNISSQRDAQFHADDPKLFVVVSALPPACDRKSFRVDVFKKGDSKPAASKTFEWSSEMEPHGKAFAFSPAALVKKNGTGRYRAALYADSQRLTDRDFQIKSPRED